MIIGLVGKNGSGKGEAAQFFQQMGYIYRSLSDVLREDLIRMGKSVTRTALTEYANELRASKGPGVLGERVLTELESHQNYVIDSIRHPAEVEALRRIVGFHLLAVEADPKIRFERIKNRGREQDSKTYETFLAQESKEAAGSKGTDQQLNKTLDMAQAVVENNSTIEELHQKIRQILRVIAMETPRPSWDEYFIQVAKQVSLRSNCIKRNVAAILVKDCRIIATGYNGTPRGIKNCNEGGCPRCYQLGPSGADMESFICSHAEENAIVQSAYHGVNVRGTTLYTTFSPCLLCTKMIINAGIVEVVYSRVYPMEEVSLRLLKEAGVKIRQYPNGNH